MWAGVACGCCLSVGEFKNLVGNIFFVWRGVVTEFDYFKKFQVFDFLKSLALAKSCRKMRFGGKIFFLTLKFPPESFKTCCSRQKWPD